MWMADPLHGRHSPDMRVLKGAEQEYRFGEVTVPDRNWSRSWVGRLVLPSFVDVWVAQAQGALYRAFSLFGLCQV